eukprot:TRINITY_DN420_c0_g1_i1.p1 TRINITY_DN420_c0_g1~~TRINITY_DN420_c0_g1_i1.p1  ORF type:complete len:1078 (+),score=241.96 TRINITY_DN420_c0_g1_i1:177-3410(+)
MRKNLQRISVKFNKGQINLEQQGTDLMQEQLRKIQDGEVWLTEIYQRLAKDVKSSQDAIDNGKYVQEAMLSYMRQIKEWETSNPESNRLADALNHAGQFQRCVDDLRHTLYSELSTKCYLPIREFVKEDIQTAKKAKKRFDAVKSKYESAQNQLKSLKAAKNVPPTKLQLAEDELREAKLIHDTMSTETLGILFATNQTNEAKTLIRLCDYFTTYHQFFKMGYKWLDNLLPTIETYRNAARQEIEEIETARKRKATTSLGRSGIGLSNSGVELPDIKERVFGVPLVDVAARENRDIPLFLQNCFEYLSLHGNDTEGIFRISATKDEIETMKSKIDRGNFEIPDGTDPHVVSNIVKLYLRALPEPLFTFDLFTAFVKSNEINDLSGRIEELNRLFLVLPKSHQAVLHALVRLCSRFAKNEAVHKMGAQNLAVVFTPNILYNKEEGDAMLVVEAMASAKNLFTSIIENADSLFPGFVSNIFESATKGQLLDVIDEFEKNKDIVSLVDEDGQTLLHKAVLSGNIRLIDFLVKSGCDVNVKDSNGATPLSLSATKDNVVAIVNLLAKNGADLQSKDNENASIWDKLTSVNPNALSKLKELNVENNHTEEKEGSGSKIGERDSSLEKVPDIPLTPTGERREVLGLTSIVVSPPPGTPDSPNSVRLNLSSSSSSSPVAKPKVVHSTPKLTGPARVAVAMINIDEIAESTFQLVMSAVQEAIDANESTKITKNIRVLADSLKKLFLEVRGFANNFSEKDKKEIITTALLLQDKIKLLLNAIKLLASSSDAENKKGFEDSCKQFNEGVYKFYQACEAGTNDVVERKIQDVAESITHILHSTLSVDPEPLERAQNAANLNTNALVQLFSLKSFTLQQEQKHALHNISNVLQTNMQLLVSTSKEISQKPKESRSTDPLTKIARVVLLELKKVRELSATTPKVSDVVELDEYTISHNIISEALQKVKKIPDGEQNAKIFSSAGTIVSLITKLKTEETPVGIAAVNNDICAALLEISHAVTELSETHDEKIADEMRLYAEAMVHADVRLKIACSSKLLKTQVDAKTLYVYAVQELASIVNALLASISEL